MSTIRRNALFAGIAAASLAGAGAASAQTCFTAFGGSVRYQFSPSPAAFKAPGTRNVAGVTFGALSACAGQNHWPLIATEIADREKIVLGFRAMTVDAASCGAVDYIVALDPIKLAGPLQLHNDRNNFSNSGTLVSAACSPVPLVAARVAEAQQDRKDQAGNSGR